MSDNPAQDFTPEEQTAYNEMQADTGPSPEPTETPIEAPSEDAAAEAPEGQQQEQPAEGEQQPHNVPYATLKEEKERRRAIEQRAADQQREWERRFNALLEVAQQRGQAQAPQQQQQQQQPSPPPLPDPEQDPVGYLVERQNRAEQALQQLAQVLIQERQQSAQQQQRAQAEAALQDHARRAEARFASEHPDYVDASNFLAQQRERELMLQGWTNDTDRDVQMRHEAMGIAQRAAELGKSPAEIVYEMARLRGYQPKQAAPEQQSSVNRVQQISNGQQQARTLSNARGAPPSAINTQAVMSMSDKEFDKFLKTATDEQKAAVYGA